MGIIAIATFHPSPDSSKSQPHDSADNRLFSGEVIHSREYRRPEDHIGKKIVVVGAGNSGADIVRHLSSLNLGHYTHKGEKIDDQADRPFTTVYQSVTGASRAGYNSGTEPWAPYIRTVATIDHFEGPTEERPKGSIHLKDDSRTVLEDIDLIIFATGYNNSLPFAKATDRPWKSANVLDEVIREDEREGGDKWEVGGVKGLHMVGLDELLLFLKADRSIAFPGLRTSFPIRVTKLTNEHTKSSHSHSPKFKVVSKHSTGQVSYLPSRPLRNSPITLQSPA